LSPAYSSSACCLAWRFLGAFASRVLFAMGVLRLIAALGPRAAAAWIFPTA